MSILNDISENLQKGRAKAVKQLVQQAIDEGIPAGQILDEGLLSGMSVIGEKFKNNEVFVPEVLVAARAMNMGAQLLKPLLAEEGVKSAGRVCIGTVKGDLHDIGKNLTGMMVEGSGWEVIDLGTDVPAEKYIQALDEHPGAVCGMSALLTTTMSNMQPMIATIRAKYPETKVVVGGAPLNAEFAQKIGADAYARDPQDNINWLESIVA